MDLFYSAPQSNLCSVGSASPISGSGSSPWGWTCSATGNGNPASCSASVKVDGECMANNGGKFNSFDYLVSNPSLCLEGNVTNFQQTSPPNSTQLWGGGWTWNCSGTNGGNPASCSAEPPICGLNVQGCPGYACYDGATGCFPAPCSGAADCADGNSCTTDVCNNPGTTSAYCSNPLISGSHCSGTSCVPNALARPRVLLLVRPIRIAALV